MTNLARPRKQRGVPDRGSIAEIAAVLASGYLRLAALRRTGAVSARSDGACRLDVPRPESPHPTDHNGEAA